MNIFILDDELETNVSYHVNNHVNKIILEVAQMMSFTLRLQDIDFGYKLSRSHVNHPCSKWIRESLYNWFWSKEYAFCLNEELKFRGKHTRDHKSYLLIKDMPTPKLSDIGPTPHAICVADDCIVNDNVVESYRLYYNIHKRHLHKWKNRNKPYWIS